MAVTRIAHVGSAGGDSAYAANGNTIASDSLTLVAGDCLLIQESYAPPTFAAINTTLSVGGGAVVAFTQNANTRTSGRFGNFGNNVTAGLVTTGGTTAISSLYASNAPNRKITVSQFRSNSNSFSLVASSEFFAWQDSDSATDVDVPSRTLVAGDLLAFGFASRNAAGPFTPSPAGTSLDFIGNTADAIGYRTATGAVQVGVATTAGMERTYYGGFVFREAAVIPQLTTNCPTSMIGGASYTVTVLNDGGQPVSGVACASNNISVIPNPANSDANGIITVAPVAAGSLVQLVFSKSGSSSASTTVTVSSASGGGGSQSSSFAFTSSATFSVPENTTSVGSVTTSGASGTVNYTISGGADQNRFVIGSLTGALAFIIAPDFEAPNDAGTNNIYDVIVGANDGTTSITQAVAVTVTDVAENTAPTITSSPTFSIPENQTAIATLTATDAQSASNLLSWSIQGGADQTLFSLTSAGVLAFQTTPNFEAPIDVGLNNVYDVIVRCTDPGGLFAQQAIAVTVTNVLESITLTGPSTVVTGQQITITALTEASVSLAGGAVSWQTGNGGTLTSPTSGSGQSTITGGTPGVYMMQVQSGAIIGTKQITVTSAAPQPPVFGGSASLAMTEGKTFAGLVSATSPSSLPLTFSILTTGGGIGADFAKFELGVANSGVVPLLFKTAPNFSPASDANGDSAYQVTVRVADGTSTVDRLYTVTLQAAPAAAAVPGIVLSPVSKSGVVGTAIEFTAKYLNASGQPVVGAQIEVIIPSNVPFTVDTVAPTNAAGVTVVRVWPGTGGIGALQVRRGLDLSNAVNFEAIDINSAGAQWNRPVLP